MKIQGTPCQGTPTLQTPAGERELNHPGPQPAAYGLEQKMQGRSQKQLTKQVCSRILASKLSHMARHLISHIPSTLGSYYIVNVSPLAFSSPIVFLLLPFL